MVGLLGDGWFYISAAGLLISGVLFFFLLGQYRAACEAADATESDTVEAPVVHAIRPVWVHDDFPSESVASVSVEKTSSPALAQAKPAEVKPVEVKPVEVKPAEIKPVEVKPDEIKLVAPGAPDGVVKPSEIKGVDKESTASVGANSPAVVYLKHIKGELSELHEELRALGKRVDAELSGVSARDQALILRLGELTEAVEALRAVGPRTAAPAPTPAAADASTVSAVHKLETDTQEMKIELGSRPMVRPASETSPQIAIDETTRQQLGSVIGSGPTQEKPVSAAVSQTPEPLNPVVQEAPALEKPRRGPVWPV
ncbi:MAG: hypothetical protein AAB036_09660 [Elusimicrobiota bacterium]